MLTPFSLRSRHGDAVAVDVLGQPRPEQVSRRRAGSERHLPVSIPATAEIRGHRGSDGSPRISLPAGITGPNAVADDVAESRAGGSMASSPRAVQTEDSKDEKSSDAGRATTSTTITTKSSQDLNSRLASSLTRWNARRPVRDDFGSTTTDNSSDLGEQLRQIAVTGDVTADVPTHGAITSSAIESQSISAKASATRIAVTSDVTDLRAPQVSTSSRRVGQPTVATSITVQASGTRSTPVVQPSTASLEAQPSTTSVGAEPPSRHPHSVSMSDIMNVEPKWSDERSASRPRSTIYGEIRDRVFGAKQPTKPVSPFRKFEAFVDESGRKVSAAFAGAEPSKHATAAVSDEGAGRAKTQLTSGAVSRASESILPATRLVGSTTAEAKNEVPRAETTASSQVPSTSQTASTVPSESRGDSVPDGAIKSVSSQQPGYVLPSSVTRKDQQSPAAADNVAGIRQQRETTSRRPLTTTAEVSPWTQSTSANRKSDIEWPKVETPTGKAGTQQIGSVLPSRTAAGETVPLSRPADHSVSPAVTTSGIQTTKGKIIPSPTSRVDWAKQRFGGAQSADAGVLVSNSSPKLKHRSFTVPQPERDVAHEKVLSNLDESIAKLTAVAATKVTSLSSSGQEQSRVLSTAATSAAGSPPSTAVHGLPFRPLTVSPPSTVSSRVAIVHGLQMSPPSSSTAPRTGGQTAGSTWAGAGRPQTADEMQATRTESSSVVRSTTSSATLSTALTPSDWRSHERPVQAAVGVPASQLPSLVSSSPSTGSAIHFHVPPAPILPPPVEVPSPPGVRSVLSVSRSHLVSTVPAQITVPPRAQMSAAMFSMETPTVTPVLARPALPTVNALVWQSDVPQIRLSVQPLKPALVIESPVPESKLVAVVPQTSSNDSQKSGPDTTVPALASSRVEDTKALYSTATTQVPTRSRTQPAEISTKIPSQPGPVAVSQTDVPASAPRTDVVVTQNQFQTPVQVGQTGFHRVQAPTQTGPTQVGLSQVQASTPAQFIQPTVPQVQAATLAQPRSNTGVEAKAQGQPSPAGVLQSQIESTAVAISSGVVSATSIAAQKGSTSQTTGQEDRRGGTAAVPDRHIVSSSVAGHRNQTNQQPAATTQVPDRQPTVASGPGDQKRRVGTAAVDDEVDRALRALDTIAAETRSLSTSLGRTATTASTTATSPLRLPTSQTSTAVVVGSPRDTAAPVADQKPSRQKSPRAETAPLQSAKSLDSSGVIKKHLVHLESMFRPGAGDPHLKKSVHLRKPRPLRKAQTVDLTHVGIGVDPELMQLLQTRKEKSASDDEDVAAKPRDDVVGATSRYCADYNCSTISYVLSHVKPIIGKLQRRPNKVEPMWILAGSLKPLLIVALTDIAAI